MLYEIQNRASLFFYETIESAFNIGYRATSCLSTPKVWAVEAEISLGVSVACVAISAFLALQHLYSKRKFSRDLYFALGATLLSPAISWLSYVNASRNFPGSSLMLPLINMMNIFLCATVIRFQFINYNLIKLKEINIKEEQNQEQIDGNTAELNSQLQALIKKIKDENEKKESLYKEIEQIKQETAIITEKNQVTRLNVSILDVEKRMNSLVDSSSHSLRPSQKKISNGQIYLRLFRKYFYSALVWHDRKMKNFNNLESNQKQEHLKIANRVIANLKKTLDLYTIQDKFFVDDQIAKALNQRFKSKDTHSEGQLASLEASKASLQGVNEMVAEAFESFTFLKDKKNWFEQLETYCAKYPEIFGEGRESFFDSYVVKRNAFYRAFLSLQS